MKDKPSSLVTPKQLAAMYGVRVATLRKWCSAGILPHYRAKGMGSRALILIDPDELLRILERREGNQQTA